MAPPAPRPGRARPARRPAAPAAEPIPLASEAAIRPKARPCAPRSASSRTRPILVLDFPTLAEQGRMLNRVAAWAEKAGVAA